MDTEIELPKDMPKENPINPIDLANSATLKDPENLQRAMAILAILWEQGDVRALKRMSDWAIMHIWLIQNPKADMRGFRIESKFVLLEEAPEERVILEAALLERGITEEEEAALLAGEEVPIGKPSTR